jgi:hypothetical protein
MLRLKKSSDGAQIHLSFRERDRFFSVLFLQALALALGFHLLGFLIFHVQPFKFTSSFRFPPVSVLTDVGSTALVQLDSVEEVSKLPPVPFTIIQPKEQESLSSSSLFSLKADFSSLDSKRQFVSFEEKILMPKVRVQVSGELAKHELMQDAVLEQEILVPIEKDPFFVTYKVQVDEKSGTVFWYERIGDSQSVLSKKLTEELLLNLKFKVDGSLNDWIGQIDFIVY